MKKAYQITEKGKTDLENELAELKGRRGISQIRLQRHVILAI